MRPHPWSLRNMLQLAGGSHVGSEPSQLEMLMTYGSHMHPQNLPWNTIF